VLQLDPKHTYYEHSILFLKSGVTESLQASPHAVPIFLCAEIKYYGAILSYTNDQPHNSEYFIVLSLFKIGRAITLDF
jgi:hypothetical protein